MTSSDIQGRVCRSDCVRWTHLEYISGSSSQHKKFISTMLGGVHHSNSWAAASPLIFNRFTIAAIAIVYCRSKMMCSSSCVRQTYLEQTFGSSSLPKKCIGTMLWGVHHSNSRASASPLILYRSTIAAIALVGLYLLLCMMNALGTNFCQLLITQEVH